MPAPEVSVIIPVLDEAENVHEMCLRLTKILCESCSSHEIIFVGGGSADGTEECVLRERASDDRIKLVWLSRNFGHQQALSAGMDFAEGEAVITMDGDLQHPPELVPTLIEEWRRGHDVVITKRLEAQSVGFLKRATSRWFYRLLNKLSGLQLTEGAADFRLLGRSATNALRQMPERSSFIRGMVQWIGFKQTVVSYLPEARAAGRSKYSSLTLLKFAFLAALSFSSIPLYLVALFGLFMAAVSFVYGGYAVVARLVSEAEPPGWASLLAAMTFLGGVQLLSLGVVGAYVARIYEETKGRPTYFVQQAYGVSRLPPPQNSRAVDSAFEPAGD